MFGAPDIPRRKQVMPVRFGQRVAYRGSYLGIVVDVSEDGRKVTIASKNGNGGVRETDGLDSLMLHPYGTRH